MIRGPNKEAKRIRHIMHSAISGTIDRLNITTPGRICLFGEHQDYLHLPVIPCAISLRLTLEGRRRTDSMVQIDLPDVRSHERFPLDRTMPYTKERDYFRSAINVLTRHGYTFSGGFECVVRGSIPINAGTSSSSALVVSWINFLTRMSDQAKPVSPDLCGRYAYEAEVLEFHEPGGMMDQYSAAVGGVSFISFHPALEIQPIDVRLETFVLGDSRQPKDTKYILSHVKNQVLDIVAHLSLEHPKFSLHDMRLEDLEQWKQYLSADQFMLLEGTIKNHRITLEAKELLTSKSLDGRRLGELLARHQSILRDILKISTPKIDRMLDAAMDSGAYGGKINGSGGGGCMFVYAPENPERIAEAIERSGGTSSIVRMDSGTRVEPGKVAD